MSAVASLSRMEQSRRDSGASASSPTMASMRSARVDAEQAEEREHGHVHVHEGQLDHHLRRRAALGVGDVDVERRRRAQLALVARADLALQREARRLLDAGRRRACCGGASPARRAPSRTRHDEVPALVEAALGVLPVLRVAALRAEHDREAAEAHLAEDARRSTCFAVHVDVVHHVDEHRARVGHPPQQVARAVGGGGGCPLSTPSASVEVGRSTERLQRETTCSSSVFCAPSEVKEGGERGTHAVDAAHNTDGQRRANGPRHGAGFDKLHGDSPGARRRPRRRRGEAARHHAGDAGAAVDARAQYSALGVVLPSSRRARGFLQTLPHREGAAVAELLPLIDSRGGARALHASHRDAMVQRWALARSKSWASTPTWCRCWPTWPAGTRRSPTWRARACSGLYQSATGWGAGPTVCAVERER